MDPHNVWRVVVRHQTTNALIALNARIEAKLKIALGTPLWQEDAIKAHRERVEEEFFKAHPPPPPPRSMVTKVLFGIITTAICGVLICVAAPIEFFAGLAITRRVYMPATSWALVEIEVCLEDLGKIDFVPPPPSWDSSVIEQSGRYCRNGRSMSPPLAVQHTIEKVRMFFPKASFEVEFFGNDPILKCTIDEGLNTDHHYLLVWDEVDGQDDHRPAADLTAAPIPSASRPPRKSGRAILFT